MEPRGHGSTDGAGRTCEAMDHEKLADLIAHYARSRIISDAKVTRVWEEPRYGVWLAWVQSKDIGTFQLQARQANGGWTISRYDGILKAT